MTKELLQQALYDIQTVLRIECLDLERGSLKLLKGAIKALRAALAQPVGVTDAETHAFLDTFKCRLGHHSDYDNAKHALEQFLVTRQAHQAQHVQPVQPRPINCGSGYCSCVECLFEPVQP